MNNFAHFKMGMRNGMPICLGYLAVSFSFGIAAKTYRLSPLAATIMSASNVTSAGQFAALALIAAGAPLWEMAVTQLIINLRYSLMSASLSQKLAPGTPFYHRFIMAFGISDEIFGISAGVPGRLSPFYTYGAMVVAIPGWTLGTLLGVVLGNIMPARLLSALGVALYGMFIAVILPPARKNKTLAGLIIASMAASALFDAVPFLAGISPGIKIILLTIAIAGIAAALLPVREEATDA